MTAFSTGRWKWRPRRPSALVLRVAPLVLLIIVWQLASSYAGKRLLPAPLAVITVIGREASSGALLFNLAVTLARVAAAFSLAMIFGTSLGVAMGRSKTVDRFCDPLLILLLNMPALVIVVLAYIWLGLTDAAAIIAVALTKLPNVAVTMREGARALDRSLEEMAQVFEVPFGRIARHVVAPQLAPYFAASARSGLSLAWKIILVAELLGRSSGVGFEIGIAFQLFDVARLLAYAIPFAALMLAIDTFFVQPFERRVSRWRLAHGA